jgi:hypothetical protein
VVAVAELSRDSRWIVGDLGVLVIGFRQQRRAPPLRGYPMVGRVLMKRLPQFGVRRWRSCRVLATEVSGDRLVDAC